VPSSAGPIALTVAGFGTAAAILYFAFSRSTTPGCGACSADCPDGTCESGECVDGVCTGTCGGVPLSLSADPTTIDLGDLTTLTYDGQQSATKKGTYQVIAINNYDDSVLVLLTDSFTGKQIIKTWTPPQVGGDDPPPVVTWTVILKALYTPCVGSGSVSVTLTVVQ
jgi:hypothetical protein